MAWSTADIPDLTGRTAVVTGANGGLGLETARALAGAGADVVMAARNQAKAADAEADIRAGNPDARLEVVALDLASQASISEAAGKILAGHPRIDVLVNNAGLMALPEQQTADGFEMQFGVNHLGHWSLTAHLLPGVLRADAARVVTVTSSAHHMSLRVNATDPHLRRRYRPWKAYGQSKLANYVFFLGLHRKFAEAGARAASYSAHPGMSNTELQAHSVDETGGLSQRFFHFFARTSGMSPASGARPQLRAATDPAARSGSFWAPRFFTNGPAVRRPVLRRIGLDRAIDSLWELSERETGIALDVGATLAELD